MPLCVLLQLAYLALVKVYLVAEIQILSPLRLNSIS